jgi:hypothetical protein
MTKRRDFLKGMGALAVGSVLLPSYKFAPKKVTNAGVQLYTFRSELMRDPKGTLKIIADLGIKQIESAASNKGLYYGLTPTEMKQTCKDLGMTLRSGHCGIDANWQRTIDQAAESGQEYLVCSSLPFSGDTIANYQRVSERFNKAGEECKKAGLKFGYHNHDFEFKKDNGQTLYDVLLKNTEPALVHMELDLGWKGTGSVEFGNGSLDIAGVLKRSKQAGLKYFFIEQEEYPAGSAEASMKLNMDYLSKINY